MRVLETQKREANDRPTEQVYAAEIKGRAVTVVMKGTRSEADDTLNPENTRVSVNKGGPPIDVTLLKRVM